jgi:hypothetical protein
VLGVPEAEGRLEPGVVAPEVWRLRPVQGHPPPCAGWGQVGPPGTTRTEEEIEMKKVYECHRCGGLFGRMSSLERHMRKAHGGK